MCPHCGGPVRGVEDGQELPGEFQITRKALLRSSLLTAMGWGCFTFVLAIASQSFDGFEKADMATRQMITQSGWTTAWKVTAIGASFGVLFALIAAFIASRRDDLDEPATHGVMPFGQAASLMPMLLLGTVAAVALALWVLPPLASAQIPLRSTLARIGIGVLVGLMAASWSHRTLFKACRTALRPASERYDQF
jgi:MFS family permease